MRRRGTLLLVALALALCGCRMGTSEPEVRSYLVDGTVDEDALTTDIQKQLDKMAGGIAKNDADRIFGIFSSEKNATYVRDGRIEEVEQARESYRRGLGKLKGERQFAFTKKSFDILNERTVLFTGLGEITSTNGKPPWGLAYTILWTLEPDGWKAINMHVSWENAKNDRKMKEQKTKN